MDTTPPRLIDNAIPPEYAPSVMSTPIIRSNSQDLNQIANPYGMHRKKFVIEDTINEEPNLDEDGHEVIIVKYINDVNIIEAVDLNDATDYYSTKKQEKVVRAKGSEAVFVNIKRNSVEAGAVVNDEKTQSICISDCNFYNVQSEIYTGSQKTCSGETLKVLGFVFCSCPDMSAHVEYTIKKFNRCSWSLTHLKRAGLEGRTLVGIYTCTLRPVIEFCSVVYHSLLTGEQNNAIKHLQRRTLKIVFGFDFSYETLLEMSGLKLLEDRRCAAVEKFAKKMLRNERFQKKWFPRWNNEFEINLRQNREFIEYHARTSRLYNSQLFHMRRLLNEC